MADQSETTVALVIPGECTHEIRPRSVMTLVLGFAVVVVILEVLAACYLRRWPVNPASAIVLNQWNALESGEPYDLLVLGDSSGLHAFDTDLASKILGIRARNACTIGASLALGDALMLERRLNRAPAPKGVLIIHTYDTWARGVTGRVLADAPVSRSDLAAAHRAGVISAEHYWGLDIYRWLPTYFRSVSIRRLIAGDAPWFASPFGLSPTGSYPVAVGKPQLARRDLQYHLSGRRKYAFDISAANRWGIGRMVALARKHGFRLMYAPGPFLDESAEHAVFAQCWETIALFLDERGGGDLCVLMRQPLLFPAEEMSSIEHVTRSAADHYTRTVLGTFPRVDWAE